MGRWRFLGWLLRVTWTVSVRLRSLCCRGAGLDRRLRTVDLTLHSTRHSPPRWLSSSTRRRYEEALSNIETAGSALDSHRLSRYCTDLIAIGSCWTKARRPAPSYGRSPHPASAMTTPSSSENSHSSSRTVLATKMLRGTGVTVLLLHCRLADPGAGYRAGCRHLPEMTGLAPGRSNLDPSPPCTEHLHQSASEHSGFTTFCFQLAILRFSESSRVPA